MIFFIYASQYSASLSFCILNNEHPFGGSSRTSVASSDHLIIFPMNSIAPWFI